MCGGSCSAARQICSRHTISMQYPQEVTMRSIWLPRHCKDVEEHALSIAVNLIPSNRPSRDSSYHIVDPKEGLAAACRLWEVVWQQVFSRPPLRLCHAHHHNLLPHHHQTTTTTTRQHTKRAEADLKIAANKLVMFLIASRYRGGHGSEASLAEVKAFPPADYNHLPPCTIQITH